MTTNRTALAFLPTELLLNILGQLHAKDIVRLMRCHRHLHYRLEPLLYASDTTRDKVMATACKRGSLETIRLLVTKYGQDPQRFHGADRVISSPLGLTVQKNQPDAYRLLISLGAKFTDILDTHWRKSRGTDSVRCRGEELLEATCMAPVLPTDRSFKWDWKTFTNIIYLPSRAEILRCLIDSATVKHVGMLHVPKFSLVSVITSGASPETVQALLDHPQASALIRDFGTGHQYHKHGGKGMMITPVTAAIIRNSNPILDLLLSRGYSMDSYTATDDPPRDTHVDPMSIPVYAAAYSMAVHGDMAMMQRVVQESPCLDINRSWPRHYKTPLNIYLDAITFWEPNKTTMITPVDGISYLVHLGAVVDWPEPYGSHQGTVLQVLFRRFGASSLGTVPGFAAAVSLLIQHGAGLFCAARLLAWVAEGRDKHPPSTVPSWWAELVKSLIDNYDDAGSPRRETIYRRANERWEQNWPRSLLARGMWHHPEGGKNKLLRDYIDAISQFTKYEAFVIERMLEAGADLNAQVKDHRGKEKSVLACALGRIRYGSWPKSYELIYFLLSKGADPAGFRGEFWSDYIISVEQRNITWEERERYERIGALIETWGTSTTVAAENDHSILRELLSNTDLGH